MEKIDLSIIVPVYNVEKYLSRCLESILNQNYKNFECIVINDGSTDNTGKICDEFSEKDERIKVIHQQNCGQSVARNKALKIAKGKYISFIDGDDYILNTYCETLINLMKENDADIAKCDYYRGELTKDIDDSISIFTGRELTSDLIVDKIGSQLWQFIFKKELWDNIFSPEGRYAQDMMVLHKVTNKAKKIVVTNKKLYFYFINRSDSTSNDKNKKIKGAFDRAIAFMERYDFAKLEGYEENCDVLMTKVLDFFNNALTLNNKHNTKYEEDIRKLSYFVRKNKYKCSVYDVGIKKYMLRLILAYVPNVYSTVKRYTL